MWCTAIARCGEPNETTARRKREACPVRRQARQRLPSGCGLAGAGGFPRWCTGTASSHVVAAVTTAAPYKGRGRPAGRPRLETVGGSAWDTALWEMMPVLRTATASARRANQLADWSAAPRACALEQTPLIRDAVSASECSRWDPEDGKELRGKAWFPRNAPSTAAARLQVPQRLTKSCGPGPGQLSRSGSGRPVAASCWMWRCTCMARATHWSLLWYS